MDYLGFPVFEFPVDWAAQPEAEMTYDLRALQLGFGPETFGATQQHVAHGFRFVVELFGVTEIDAFDAFLDGLQGTRRGFWLPGPQVFFRITAGVNAGTFDISAQSLSSTWQDHPSQYVYFEKPGQAARVAKISGVTISGNAERVTLDENLASTLDATWTARRLHFVRLVGETEEAEYLGEQRQARSVRVVELPMQYGVFTEDTAAPVYLYDFFADFGDQGTVHWRYTSHADAVVSNGETYAPAPMEHGAITRTLQGGGENVQLTTAYAPDDILSALFPVRLARPLEIVILEVDLSTPNVATTLFAGRVVTAAQRGRARVIQCASWLDALTQSVPGFWVQPRCNYRVFDPETCRASFDDFSVAATISAMSGRSVTVTGGGIGGKAQHYFSEGWLSTGLAETLEERTILASGTPVGSAVVLTLNAPLTHAILGQAVTLAPGCDGAQATCVSKYNNLVNYGGISAPRRNLTLKAIRVQTNAAKK